MEVVDPIGSEAYPVDFRIAETTELADPKLIAAT